MAYAKPFADGKIEGVTAHGFATGLPLEIGAVA
jgi:hypothetical protein